MKWKSTFLCASFFFCFSAGSFCQFTPTPSLPPDIALSIQKDSSVKFSVAGISILGNKKTKSYIIQRELRFKEGDSIAGRILYDMIHQSRSLVYNTTLFTLVDIFPEFQDSSALHFTVIVREKWYIYPTPQFQLADRNFNEWINTYNADMKRVIYGAKFTHYNLSGRRDKLDVYLLNGFARNISATYTAPYSNRSLTEGFSASASYTQNREIPYSTTNENKFAFVRSGRFVRENFAVGGTYIRRTGHYWRQTFGAAYTFTTVADTILSPGYNPNYFNNEKSYQNFSDLTYSLQYLNVDNSSYPLKGRFGKIQLQKRGLGFSGGINATILDGLYSRYFDLGKKWYSSIVAMGKITVPFNQPYINQRALGFGEYYLRGHENFVIDGPASVLLKTTLKKQLLSFKLPLPFSSNLIPYIPFTFFAKVYGDAGYAFQREELDTRLNNKLLYTGGFGLDILTLYDINFRIEYSFNQLNQNGLFLHSQGGF